MHSHLPFHVPSPVQACVGVIVVWICCWCTVASAQDLLSKRAQWWINAGAGVGPIQHQVASFSEFSGGYSYNRNSARLWQIGANVLYMPETKEEQGTAMIVVHVAAGKTHLSDQFRSSVFIGPGMVGVGDFLFDGDEVNTIGIVANAQVFAIGLPRVGVGLELYGVLNTVRSGMGWWLSFQLNNNRK